VLDSPSHRYFLFEFLPVGREEQNVVMVTFSEERAGEDLVVIPEVGVTVVGSMSSADLNSCMLSQLHHESLITKHTPLPFFPERYLILSAR
jgi:hypothetical protein